MLYAKGFGTVISGDTEKLPLRLDTYVSETGLADAQFLSQLQNRRFI